MTGQGIKVIGLTGGIGTGKSTAADYLRSRGFAHIDADAIGRTITADGSPMLPVLNELFGSGGKFGRKGVEILRSDGSLDRPALASLVFTDKARKQQLDKVMFEAIVAEIDRQIDELREKASAASENAMDEAAAGDEVSADKVVEKDKADEAAAIETVEKDRAVIAADEAATVDEDADAELSAAQQPMGIILDAPLLFEAGLDDRCDSIILLVADEAVRIRRVCSRDGVTEQEVRNRINSQLSDDEKKKKSHIIIDNSGTKEALEAALERFCINF